MDSLTETSKYLAYILRHRPDVAGISLDKEGWCDVEELLQKTKITRGVLYDIVDGDDKQRYTFSPDGKKVRANQGHSAKGVKLTFKREVPPTVLYHGTSEKALMTIMKEGLKPMNRHHVHLSADVEVAKSVAGRRKGDVTILTVDAKRMLTDGHKFFLSDNGVWLVDAVNPKYLTPS